MLKVTFVSLFTGSEKIVEIAFFIEKMNFNQVIISGLVDLGCFIRKIVFTIVSVNGL